MGEGEDQNKAKEGWTEPGNRLKKGPQKLGQCLPKSSVIPEMTIKSDGLDSHIQYMKDHMLIEKFVGMWPPKKALIWWINTT